MASPSLSSRDGDRIPVQDVEKHAQVTESQRQPKHRGFLSFLKVDDGEVYDDIDLEKRPKWYQMFLDTGAEENGIKPVPLSKRTNRQYSNLFTMFFTCLLCLLP